MRSERWPWLVLCLLFVRAATAQAQDAETPSCESLRDSKTSVESTISTHSDEIAYINRVTANRRAVGMGDLHGMAKDLRTAQKGLSDAFAALQVTLSGLVEYGCDGQTTTDVSDTTSQCSISRDLGYGSSARKPIQIGRGGVDRMTTYLAALRGPSGEGLRYLMDPFLYGGRYRYVLTYPGLKQPMSLYVDVNKWSEPMAPVGMICGAPIGLTKPR